MAESTKTVCVTGASGYLASHVVKCFVDAGSFEVPGTVRSLARKEKVAHLTTQFPNVKLFEADLLKEGSFKEAFTGCDMVIHCASPFLSSFDDPQKELIDPAVAGTTNVMEAAVACGVKRVVVTSSCAAVMTQDSIRRPQDFVNKVWSHEDWNRESTLDDGAYRLSKQLAEEKAWTYHSDKKVEVATINPAFIVGPSLSSRTDPVSVQTMLSMLNGDVAEGITSNACFGCVYVGDVAEAHFLAATTEEAKGKRFVLSSEDGFDHLQMARCLSPQFDSYPVPTKFKEGVAIKYRPYYDSSLARTVLGLNLKPIGWALNLMAADLVKRGLVK